MRALKNFNLASRLKSKLATKNGKLVALIFLFLAIPLTIFVGQQIQDLRQRASEITPATACTDTTCTTWKQLAGKPLADPSVVKVDNTMFAFYHDTTDQSLRYLVSADGGTNFKDTNISGTAKIVGNPSATVWDKRVHVFVRGTDNGVWYKGILPAGGWSDWIRIAGNYAVSSEPVAINYKGYLFVFVRGVDNEFYYNMLPSGIPAVWSGFYKVGAGQTFTSAPRVSIDNDWLYIEGTGPDGKDYSKAYNTMDGKAWPNTVWTANSAPSSFSNSTSMAGKTFEFRKGATAVEERHTIVVKIIPPSPTPTVLNLTPDPCSFESQLKTVASTQPTTIQFINKTPATAKVYWINTLGQRVLYNTLPAGASQTRETFYTHPWVVTDSNDKCIAVYQPTQTPSVATINIPKVTAVSMQTSPTTMETSCPAVISQNGYITADGPGLVTYRWFRDNGYVSDVKTIGFATAGTKEVYDTWSLGVNGNASYSPYNGWVSLGIGDNPSAQNSGQTPFSLTCRAATTPQVTQLNAAVYPPSLTTDYCPASFTFLGAITVNGPTTVRYQWNGENGAVGRIQDITFTAAGTQNVSTTSTLGSNSDSRFASYTGYRELKIISPNNALARKAEFKLSCKQLPTPTTVTPPTTSPTGGTMSTPTGGSCAQVLTPARNTSTQVCATFPTACLPAGWVRDTACENSPMYTPTPPTVTQTQGQVTNVIASVSPGTTTSASCPITQTFTGQITTNGPATVTYRWVRNDNSAGPIETVTFTAAGTKQVQREWELGLANDSRFNPYNGWQQLEILTPNSLKSSQATFSQTCTPTPTLSGNAPTLTFTATPTSISEGQTSRVTWSTTNATSCTGQSVSASEWSGTKATSGSQVVGPFTLPETYILSLTCTGTGGSVTKTVGITYTGNPITISPSVSVSPPVTITNPVTPPVTVTDSVTPPVTITEGVTLTPPPTGTLGTGLTFSSVLLHGIGISGDNFVTNPDECKRVDGIIVDPEGCLSNQNPKNPERKIFVEVYNTSNEIIETNLGNITYDPDTGTFKGEVILSDAIATGTYIVKVITPNYLRRAVPNAVTITQGQKTSVSNLELISSDVDGDNKLTILDYSLIDACYVFPGFPASCSPEEGALVDLNDDGLNDDLDRNLFRRELSVQYGE